jgi:hypothetical protein
MHLQIEQGVPAARAIAAGLRAVVVSLRPGMSGAMTTRNEPRLEQRERMARGGRARARQANHAPDGTFLP